MGRGELFCTTNSRPYTIVCCNLRVSKGRHKIPKARPKTSLALFAVKLKYIEAELEQPTFCRYHQDKRWEKRECNPIYYPFDSIMQSIWGWWNPARWPFSCKKKSGWTFRASPTREFFGLLSLLNRFGKVPTDERLSQKTRLDFLDKSRPWIFRDGKPVKTDLARAQPMKIYPKVPGWFFSCKPARRIIGMLTLAILGPTRRNKTFLLQSVICLGTHTSKIIYIFDLDSLWILYTHTDVRHIRTYRKRRPRTLLTFFTFKFLLLIVITSYCFLVKQKATLKGLSNITRTLYHFWHFIKKKLSAIRRWHRKVTAELPRLQPGWCHHHHHHPHPR